MSSRQSLNWILILILLSPVAAGCSTPKDKAVEKRKEMAAELCEFEARRKTTLISHIDNRGGVIIGDVDVRQVARTRTWASALATTKKPVTVIGGLVTNMEPVQYCNPYFGTCGWSLIPVTRAWTSSESLEEVFGLARVPVHDPDTREDAMEEAKNMALDNCQSMAGDFAEKTSGVERYDPDLRCIVFHQELCH